jgi:hypothetical protein
LSILATVAGALALASCHARTTPETPAVVTNTGPESRAELRRVVSEALGGAPVTLADDALVHESTLTIERARPRDAEGRPLGGRERERPEHFRLVKSGGSCVLVQESTGRRFPLTAVACSPK